MKLNPDKCKLIIAGHKASICSIKVGNAIISEQDEVRLLGVIIDNKLSFKSHLEEKLKKANSKLMVINRNKSFLTFTQKKMLLSSFVHSHFSYAPLIWMFHNRDIQNKIDNVQKKALKILYNEPEMSFDDLLVKDGGCANHIHNIHLLMIEMYKAQ